MTYGGYSYIDLNYEPSESDIVTLLWVSGSERVEKLAESVASESSVGTWTALKTMNQFVWDKLRARIFRIEKSGSRSGFVWIAYPLEHFDHDNLLQILASIRGNIFGMKGVEELYIMDWTIPKRLQEKFSGPNKGVQEIRKYLKTEESGRPHVGTIVKPKVGLTPEEFSRVAYESFANGLDLVKDDENLVNQSFCPWEDRVIKVIEAADKARDETGDNKIYVPNITDFLPRMLERIDWLVEHGWRMAMIDVYMIGLAGLKEVLDELHKKDFLVHAHRAGYAAEVRGRFGVSFAFWEKIYRLLGVDQLHTGTGIGKMEGSPVVIRKLGEIAREYEIRGMEPAFLDFEWDSRIKSLMPVASGGLHPGMVEAEVAVYGTTDLTIQAGGGVHGHPGGTSAGARAMRNAAELVAGGIPLDEGAGKELKDALSKWGYIPAGKVQEVFNSFESARIRWMDILRQEGLDGMKKLDREVSV